MRMGVREICDVVFRPLTAVDIGNQHFDAGQPVLYLDTAKTSTLEGAATTVYAQGGKGNPRLIGWDGEKTLTFTVEDALISAVSFSMLSGAGIVKGRSASDTDTGQKIYAHQTYDLEVKTRKGALWAKLPNDVRNGATIVISREAPIYATTLDSAGAPRTFLSAITLNEIETDDGKGNVNSGQYKTGVPGELDLGAEDTVWFKIGSSARPYTDNTVAAGNTVRIDCYTVHTDGAQEIQIDAENFAGYYYIEADTLFRDESTGQDVPAQFIIPRGKIQSNFTFTMANSGDPSTFTFTIDAFPAYTKFNKRKKVMAALQIIDPIEAGHNYADKTIIGHEGRNAGLDIYGEGPASATDVDKIYDTSIFEENIGEATADDEQAVAAVNNMPVGTDAEKLAALQAYTKLTSTQQALVNTDVKIAIGVATDDEIAVATVVEAANALTSTSEADDIAAVFKAYAQLTDEQEQSALSQFSETAKEVLGL